MPITNPTTSPLAVTSAPASNGATTSVASAAVDTLILAANAGRLGGVIHNDSTKQLYLLLATGAASLTNWTYSVDKGGVVEIPFNYTGVIRGIWQAANGFARVTEFSP